LVDHAISPRRFIVLLLTGFATFALVLVSLGIYSVVSYSVTRRTQEIGIRMALGAQGARVQRQIVMETLGRATIGLAIGTVAAAVAVMLAVAGLAGYLPARRASRIDPLVALRVE
jgi:ABC-type antimicrobial peptide transport system permease subunit